METGRAREKEKKLKKQHSVRWTRRRSKNQGTNRTVVRTETWNKCGVGKYVRDTQ